VSITGPDIARLGLVPARAEDQTDFITGNISVALNASDPEYALLCEWLEKGSDLGVVIPDGGQLIRLRNLEDLQPLTLRRIDSSTQD
jgi:hypothetical protein